MTMRAMQMLPMQNPVQTNAQRVVDPDNSFINSVQDAQQQGLERDKFAYQQQMDVEKLRRQDDDIERQGYEAMMKNPSNAAAIAQQYNIPFTPAVQELLKNPLKMERVIQAASVAKTMGIANPQALQTFMRSYLQQGDFDPAMQSIEGMDMQAPMTPYQQATIAQQQARTGIMAQNAANMQQYRRHQMNKSNENAGNLKLSNLSPEEQLEMIAYQQMLQRGKMIPNATGFGGSFDEEGNPIAQSITDTPQFKRMVELTNKASGQDTSPPSETMQQPSSMPQKSPAASPIVTLDADGNEIFNFDAF